MQLLVSFKFRRDQMRCDREECGVHAAPPSTFHQQPHYGGTPALPFQLKCSVSDVVPTTPLLASDLPQVGWIGWGHREVPTTSGFMEEVRVLYITLRLHPWIC
jgi:hypothetical protein